MIEPIQTSNDSEAVASPMTAEAKNANEGPEMAETGSPQTKTEPENAASQTSEEPAPQGSPRQDEVGPGEPGPTDSKHSDGPEKTKRRTSDAVMMLQTSPLAAGEDFADYRALMDKICGAVDRKDFFDELRVADLGHALWEENRYRRQLVALSQGNAVQGPGGSAAPDLTELQLEIVGSGPGLFWP